MLKLKKTKFGRTGDRVSELCLSTSNFSRYASQEVSCDILDAFRAAGGNFIQTSGICPGVNLGDGLLGLPEEALGRWLKRRRVERGSIVIATRIALTRPVIGGLATYTELIQRCAEDSIRRMGCGHLDFLVVEWTDAILPVAESLAALAAVAATGAVRALVPANFPVARLREGLAATPSGSPGFAGLQVDYSLAERLPFESGAARLSADYGLGVTARSPLAGGHLARRAWSGGLGARPHPAAGDRHAAIAAEGIWPVLSALARSHRCSPAQIALSWVLAHPRVTSVLVSVSSVDQLRELLAATRLELPAEHIARLGTTPVRPWPVPLRAEIGPPAGR
jgi:aryl-alcohol dehydrogenase-like predicted oxidoreductase